MKKIITSMFLFLAVSAYSADENQLREWERTTWRLNINLTSENLQGGAVQFSITEKDPRDSFRKDYKKLKERAILEKRYDDESEFSIKLVAWDVQFRGINGDEVYLLVKGDVNGFSSNKPEMKYYLVTKATVIKGRPAVWFIPVKVKTGKEKNIVLSDSNILYLDDLLK